MELAAESKVNPLFFKAVRVFLSSLLKGGTKEVTLNPNSRSSSLRVILRICSCSCSGRPANSDLYFNNSLLVWLKPWIATSIVLSLLYCYNKLSFSLFRNTFLLKSSAADG